MKLASLGEVLIEQLEESLSHVRFDILTERGIEPYDLSSSSFLPGAVLFVFVVLDFFFVATA